MNFSRVVRMAIRYKITFAASVVSALLVAVFWGANIGAVYPVVEVVFKNKSMHQWIDEKIGESRVAVAAQTANVDRLRKLADEGADDQSAAKKRNLQWDLANGQAELAAATKGLERYVAIKPYINRYLPQTPFRTLVLVTLVLVVGTLIKDVFLVINNLLVARLSQRAVFDLRKLFYRRTLRMDLATFGEDGTADLMSRFTNDMNQVAGGLDSLFGKLVREPLKAIACLVGAAIICWRLLLLTLIVTPLAAFSIRWLAKMLKRANRRAMEEISLLYGTLEETFRSIKIVKAFTNEQQERKRFHDNNKRYYHKAMGIARYDSLSHPMTEVMGIITISLVMVAGGWLIFSRQTTLLGIPLTDGPLNQGAMLTFFAMLAGMADPLRKMSDIFSNLQAGFAASDRIFARLDREPSIRDPKQPAPASRHHRDLTFEKISFAYQPGKQVIEDLSLKIAFGETIAIVGPNGCGKSTLANLIPRFADPTSGVVKLDGVPLPKMRLRDLRRQIGVVTQETMLFDDTIFNNIRYGTPNATPEQVIAAAKQAHAHRFIEQELPNGYETSAGALGARLSGGQRQRIALARAILRDPAILILDEATSQVDLESEQAIQQVLEKFTQNRTTILITHRLAVLSLADRIVVMQAGRILDVGSHEELLSRCSLYRRLYEIHFDDLKQTA
ncbi:MAG: ABC transporter ATP-binding protein/permease [Planctomycetaceae bacterium]|nr:ABC transporter ATP-binding protein/permease [Planctomycetaceae bacterium]